MSARPTSPTRRWVADLGAVLPAWFVARVLVGVGYAVVRILSDELAPPDRPFHLDEGLLAWDGGWYRQLAESGYGPLGVDGSRFYPLFPLLGRLLSPLLGGREDLALVVIANVAALGALVLVRRLVLGEGHDDRAADLAVWVVALFPASFVLAWAYTEPLMLVGVAGGLLELRRGRWWSAAAFGVIAGLSRPLGSLLALAALVEVVPGWRRAATRDRLARVGAVVAAPMAGAAYVLWVSGRVDTWLAPMRAQDELRGDVVFPVARLIEGLGEAVDDPFGDGLHLPFALGFAALAVASFWLVPRSFAVFGAAVLAVALAAENLNSLERYGLNALPLLLTVALLADRRDWLARSVVALSAGGLVALCALAWGDAYVP